MKRVFAALVLAAATLIPAAAAHAQVGVAVQIGGYVPPCPGPGYIWAPGYYAGTIWVPGRWVYRAYYGPHYHYHPAHAWHYDHGYRR